MGQENDDWRGKMALPAALAMLMDTPERIDRGALEQVRYLFSYPASSAADPNPRYRYKARHLCEEKGWPDLSA